MVTNLIKENVAPFLMKKQPVGYGKATMADAVAIKALVDAFANTNDVLPRTLGEMYENIRDYVVARSSGEVVGCVALHCMWEDIAELRSLIVKEAHQHKGIGTALLEHALSEAKAMGIKTLVAFTYSPGFFEKLGFGKVVRKDLPPIIFVDSLKCPKYPNCDCVPMSKVLAGSAK